MSLKEIPPKIILSELERIDIQFNDVLLAISTDINTSGERSVQWLIASKDRLFVFDPLMSSILLFFASFQEMTEIRNIPVIGSGIMQIRIESIWLDLIRFSNRNTYKFNRVLKRLLQIKKGEKLLPFEADQQDPQRCLKCDLMLEFPGEICPRCLDHGAAVNRVIQLLRPYWRTSVVLATFLLMGVGLDMVWPMLTRYLVDHVLSQPSTPTGVHDHPIFKLSTQSPYRLLTLIVVALASVHILRGFVNHITTKIGSQVGNAMTFDIRARLVKKLEELGLAYYSKQETGSLVGRIAYDTEAIQGFISQITSGFVMQFLLVIISFSMMFSLEPALALWAMVPAPLVIGGAFVYWRYVHLRFQRYWDRSSKQAGLLNGILSGIRVVKAFEQEENEFNRFQKISMEVRNSRQTLDRTSSYFYPIMALVFQVGGWLIWYIGGCHVLKNQISLGTLMAFFGYLSLFYGPLGNLTNLTTWLTQFSTQMHRIFEILDTPTILPVAQKSQFVEHREGKIEFRDVTFGYSRGIPIVNNLSFEIKPGEKIGIVGRSGSGKTSIVNLLARFYDIDSGQIRIDGVDIRNMSKHDLRSRISMVLQEPFLFRGTLCENIVYGHPVASREEIINASRSSNAHDFIMQHPLAYDTSVGERGQELSGGERQRISIARALLCQSPILILDEATSSLDSESEAAIQTALEEGEFKNRTTLMIAHRLSTLQNCDRILVIEHGQVAESGTHRELITLNGRYATWLRIQQGNTSLDTEDELTRIHPHPFHNSESQATSSSGLPSIHGYSPRWLRPGVDSFECGPRKELQIHIPSERVYRGVFALRCFPVHQPDCYISVRFVNAENRIQEIGIVQNLKDWPLSTQHLIEESLGRRYFFQKIRKLNSVKKTSQFLTFNAQTDLGDVEFMMRQDPESSKNYGDQGKLLIDVEDNLYIIQDLKGLTRADREIFNRYIYW